MDHGCLDICQGDAGKSRLVATPFMRAPLSSIDPRRVQVRPSGVVPSSLTLDESCDPITT